MVGYSKGVISGALVLLLSGGMPLVGDAQFAVGGETFTATNLDQDCEPKDIIDSLRARLTPETFWKEQRADLAATLKGIRTMAPAQRALLEGNRRNRGQAQAEMMAQAKKQGFDAGDVKEAMREYDRMASELTLALRRQKVQEAWASTCLMRVEQRIRQATAR